MAPNLFRVLLILVALYAFLRGRRDEKHAVIILVVGVIATELVLPPRQERFDTIEINLLLVDLAVLGGFVWVALRSNRFWPLWVAGLQLTTILGHLLKAMNESLFTKAYGAALVFWFYPMLLILVIGTWRTHRRKQLESGAAPA